MGIYVIFLSSIYSWSRVRLKGYDNSFVYFSAKLNLCLLCWIYAYHIWFIIERETNWTILSLDSDTPKYVYVIIIFITYAIISIISLNLKLIIKYTNLPNNQSMLKKGRIIYFLSFICGFTWLTFVAIYNK